MAAKKSKAKLPPRDSKGRFKKKPVKSNQKKKK